LTSESSKLTLCLKGSFRLNLHHIITYYYLQK